jgi:hypothetical protein
LLYFVFLRRRISRAAQNGKKLARKLFRKPIACFPCRCEPNSFAHLLTG